MSDPVARLNAALEGRFAMTVLGFLSGILCALVEFSPDSVSRLIPGEDENIVGVIFGIVIGLYLYRLRLASAMSHNQAARR